MKTKIKTSNIGLAIGPILFAITIVSPIEGVGGIEEEQKGLLPFSAKLVLATALWMASWWITEAIPIYVTALLPLIIFPSIHDPGLNQSLLQYADRIVFLFLGGFLLAQAIEKARLHERIALNILKIFGTNPKYIVASFIIVTGFLSAWMSNTATAMLMVPIAAAVISQVPDKNQQKIFGLCLMLSIAYSASLGGMATLIGTPPNAIFASLSKSTLNFDVSFSQWMLIGMPISAISLFILWLYMINFGAKISHISITHGKELIMNRLSKLGKITKDEKIVATIFAATAIAWITRGLLWKDILPSIDDSTIVLVSCFILFLIPSSAGEKRPTDIIDKDDSIEPLLPSAESKLSNNGRNTNNNNNSNNDRKLLDWHAAVKIPWGVILLIGGGLALASGFSATELDSWIANQLFTFIKDMNYLIMAVIIVALAIFVSELISNTATAALLIPIAASVAALLEINPLLLMIPVTLATSYGFVMPAGTPPNAIVFGSGYVSANKMAKVGFPLDTIGIVIVVLFSTLIIGVIL
jgi:sodium-dependent dicarboxylate transporter 2/3/5